MDMFWDIVDLLTWIGIWAALFIGAFTLYALVAS